MVLNFGYDPTKINGKRWCIKKKKNDDHILKIRGFIDFGIEPY